MKHIRAYSAGILATAVFGLMSVQAHNLLPAPKQDHPIMLKSGTLHTVSQGVLENTDILFDKGRIVELGRDLPVPVGAEIIDVSGQQVYPGIIDASTSIGLVEIGSIRATNDITEIGQNNPDVVAHTAYNPDSEIIPTIRSNGVTTALIVPGGSLIAGRSSLINLDGWSVEDATVKKIVALHVSWPQVGIVKSWQSRASSNQQQKIADDSRGKIKTYFDDAHGYFLARKANSNLEIDSHWEAMIPVFTGDLPVFINADSYRQIEDAVSFANEYKFRMVLVSGGESWKLAGLLKANNIPVVLTSPFNLPQHEDDDYDQGFKVAATLRDSSVTFCLATFSASGSRNLPFYAGQAAAYGLTKEEALRAITLSSAEILGVQKDLGSIETGKAATLVISSGDILDPSTQKVTAVFIEGKKIDLDNRHSELYRKYQAKHWSPTPH